MRALRCLILIAAFLPAAAHAMAPTPSGLPVPRFVTLKFTEVNGRAGPSPNHPVRWTYQRQGLPVQVVAETENWRRVMDPEGDLVWMHKRTLDGARAVIPMRDTALRSDPARDSEIEAVAEAGAVLVLKRCDAGWCRTEAQGFEGWISAAGLWGLNADERPGP